MLDRRLYKIIESALDETSIKNYIEDFSSRVIVQKVLYILSHGKSNPKLDLPYKWSFYLHGPYSSDIAHMLYHINDFWNELKDKTIELNKEDNKVIKFFKDFKKNLDTLKKENNDLNRISEAELYEILATLIYIAKQIGKEEIILINKLKTMKPELSEKMTSSVSNSIYHLLNNYNYI